MLILNNKSTSFLGKKDVQKDLIGSFVQNMSVPGQETGSLL
jgi:hypothetical protein